MYFLFDSFLIPCLLCKLKSNHVKCNSSYLYKQAWCVSKNEALYLSGRLSKRSVGKLCLKDISYIEKVPEWQNTNLPQGQTCFQSEKSPETWKSIC